MDSDNHKIDGWVKITLWSLAGVVLFAAAAGGIEWLIGMIITFTLGVVMYKVSHNRG